MPCFYGVVLGGECWGWRGAYGDVMFCVCVLWCAVCMCECVGGGEGWWLAGRGGVILLPHCSMPNKCLCTLYVRISLWFPEI